MPAYKKINKLPPCPDPEKYILVRTKEGVFWRRKRGTVKPARLNSAFAQNVSNSKVAGPAAKKIIQKLHPWLENLDTGRLTARLAGLLIKTINQKGYPDFSLLKGLEFHRHALDKLLRLKADAVIKADNITIRLPIRPGLMVRHGESVTDFYFEAILVYGDVASKKGLRIESTISRLYSFEDTESHVCEMVLDLPVNKPWMVILKASCQEANRPSISARHFGMSVVEVG